MVNAKSDYLYRSRQRPRHNLLDECPFEFANRLVQARCRAYSAAQRFDLLGGQAGHENTRAP